VLEEMGIEKDRFRLEWISASEGDKVRSVVNDMVAKVKALGPLRLTPRPFPQVIPAEPSALVAAMVMGGAQ